MYISWTCLGDIKFKYHRVLLLKFFGFYILDGNINECIVAYLMHSTYTCYLCLLVHGSFKIISCKYNL